MTGIKQQWGKGNSNLLAELVMTRFERVRCSWICDWLQVQMVKSSLHFSKKEWVAPPLLFIFILIGLVLTVHVRSSTSTEAAAAAARHYSIPFIRSSFPASFIFGAGSAAYQALEDEYGGFLNHKIIGDFQDYADFCFKTFGDRVAHWITLKEPVTFCVNGFKSYNGGTNAPGRCSNYVGNCTAGNSATEPYIVGHHLLLAHTHSVNLYKKYQTYQKGQIGISVATYWYLAKSETAASKKAASRSLDFVYGWFAHPVTFGDYPQTRRSSVADWLPKFSKEETKLLKGSLDFLGVDYYTSSYAEASSLSISAVNQSFFGDIHT